MKNKLLKKITVLALCAAMALALAGCKGGTSVDIGGNTAVPTNAAGNQGEADVNPPASDESVSASEVTGEFIMNTADGNFVQDGSKYTVTAAGTYSLRGALEGQIVVSAGEADEVVLELNGVTITNAEDSPIKILSADKVEISAKKGTGNVINDNRPAKAEENDTTGEGAIYAKADLKLKGAGTLVINASYNNGVHTTKDLTLKKLSLKVTARNNALKGNDSIKVESGTIIAISTEGDGIKTSATDMSKSGAVRGDVHLSGGSIAIYAAGDGIQAAHDFILEAADGFSPNVSVFTGSYSGYTAETASTTSYKGVKAGNEIRISAGSIAVSSYDDGLHADFGTAFESGGAGTGNVTITGGTVTTAVYSPEGKTGGGKHGPDGHEWGGQQAVSGADGIHADGVLSISGGTVNMDSAYEGVEANVINVSGGSLIITANDDGINACKGQASPAVNISGGFLDITVPADGDVDGIDSNGLYTQTGGVVITRGPNIEMAAAIDAEASVSVTGGTLLALGYGRIQTGGDVKEVSLSLHSQGDHTLTVGGNTYSFTNIRSYGQTVCVSDTQVSGN